MDQNSIKQGSADLAAETCASVLRLKDFLRSI